MASTYSMYYVYYIYRVGRSIVDYKVFFQCIGLYVLLKLMLGLKRTSWCGLDPWLTIYSILTSYFLAMA